MEIGTAFCKSNHTISSWTFQKPFSGCIRLVPGNCEADWGYSRVRTTLPACGVVSPAEGKARPHRTKPNTERRQVSSVVYKHLTFRITWKHKRKYFCSIYLKGHELLIKQLWLKLTCFYLILNTVRHGNLTYKHLSTCTRYIKVKVGSHHNYTAYLVNAFLSVEGSPERLQKHRGAGCCRCPTAQGDARGAPGTRGGGGWQKAEQTATPGELCATLCCPAAGSVPHCHACWKHSPSGLEDHSLLVRLLLFTLKKSVCFPNNSRRELAL